MLETLETQGANTALAECYNVLSPFFAIFKCHQVFYLLSNSHVAYLDCVGVYKTFNFSASIKTEFLKYSISILTNGMTAFQEVTTRDM